jgi:hypothetical protein
MADLVKKYKFTFLVLSGLIILNFSLFFLNLNNFFLSDDFDWLYLTKNSQSSIIGHFTSNYYGERGVGGSYRPLVNLVFWLNYKIGGLNPLPYHLTNLLFHIGICFLVYLLVLILFEDFKEKNKIAILAAIFFSILPNHSEAIIWISAIADPVAVFFYLLAFYLYLLFRKRGKIYFVLFSIISFILALLAKELAITLPLLILIWEFYEALENKSLKWKNIILRTLAYWMVLLAYLSIRYFSIGLVFGYYAREKFKLNLVQMFKMFVSLIINSIFYGHLRVALTNFFTDFGFIFIFLLIVALFTLWSVLKKYGYKISFLLISYLILILPVLFLSFNNFNDEGERYNYLPSIVFCIILALLVFQINKIKTRVIVFACLAIYFSVFLLNKNLTWNLAGQLSQKIVINDLPKIVDLNKRERVLFVSLPDNLDGAQVLRNGILQAIDLYYPANKLDTELLNAYVRLTRKNYNQKILNWATYPTGGYIAKTIDGKFWVTGFDRRETDDYTFELWNYNYNNYTTDTIRLILKNKDFKVLIFNQGELQILQK